MTPEEKAKAYAKVREKIAIRFGSNVADEIFSQYETSEDEKIRKEMLQIVKESEDSFYMVMTPDKRKRIIDWLEKQGEQKPVVTIPKFRIGDEIKTSNEESLTITKIDEKGYWSEDLFICGFNDAGKWELVEQKLTDKVEPKFKVGDIVKYKKNPYLTYILKRFTDDGDYEFHAIGKDGNEGGTCFADVEYQDEWELVKQKTAWSEENEAVLDALIRRLEGEDIHVSPHLAAECLKSLKEKYTWKPSDEQNIHKNGVYQEADGVRIWHNGHTFLVPKDWNKGKLPLLNKKGEENSKQNKEHLMNEMDALLDWDFVAATKHIQDLGTDIPLKDGEYLITAPVWLAMYEHRIALNKALSNIGAMEIDFNEDFWFAQRSYVNVAWIFYGTTRTLYSNHVYYAYQVGAVTL